MIDIDAAMPTGIGIPAIISIKKRIANLNKFLNYALFVERIRQIKNQFGFDIFLPTAPDLNPLND